MSAVHNCFCFHQQGSYWYGSIGKLIYLTQISCYREREPAQYLNAVLKHSPNVVKLF
jgi:hypothetical protein